MPKIRTPRRIKRAGRRPRGIDRVHQTETVYCATPEEIEVLTERALKLRLEGRTYEQIAQIIGYSYKRTYDFVQMALARRRDITDELAAQLRNVQLERLYRIYEAHAPTVESVKSAMVMLKVLEREARLIGLDAPEPIVFPPVVPPDDYDFSRLSIEEQLALRDLLLKCAIDVAGRKVEAIDGGPREI